MEMYLKPVSVNIIGTTGILSQDISGRPLRRITTSKTKKGYQSRNQKILKPSMRGWDHRDASK